MNPRAWAAATLFACTATLLVAPPPTAAAAVADQVRDRQWHHRFLNTARAHQISQGEGVTVAVIDTGVNPHPDLRNNLLRGTNIATGAEGRTDSDGHGTMMAGLIAAHGRGKNGILGIAPKARILPVRAHGVHAGGTPDELAQAIEWATTHGAKVINISLGGGISARLIDAVEEAVRADIVMVAAAGNRPDAVNVAIPGSLDGVLAVGAVDQSGSHAKVSVSGPEVDISAPGVMMVSTNNMDGYSTGVAGTSDSTAIVSGAAALVRSLYPELSAEEVVHRLTATAIDRGPKGRDDQYGYGVLNLVGALTATVPPSGSTTPSATPFSAEPVSPYATTPQGTAAPGQAGGRGGNSSSSTGLMVTIGAIALSGLLGAALVVLVHRRRRLPSDGPQGTR